MNIALLCLDPGVPLGGPKGSSIHLRSVASALLRSGHRVTALVAAAGPEEALAPLARRGFEWRTAPDEGKQEWLTAEILRAGCELVVERLALGPPDGARAAARAGVPHVFEVNAPLDEEARRYRGLADGSGALEEFREGFAASGGALAVSTPVAEWVRGLAPPGFLVRVLPNGVEEAFFTPPPEEALEHARRLLGQPRGFRVAFAGSFRPWHDLPGLVRALERLKPEAPAQLVLVGDGPQRNDVLAQCYAAGVPVVLTGRVPHDEVPPLLALCDAVAIPCADPDAYFSPLKLFEAMAAGRAIVASGTRGCREVLRHAMDALLVPPGDDEAFAAALLRLAREDRLRERLGEAARRQARALHTWDRVAAEVLRFAANCAPRGAAR